MSFTCTGEREPGRCSSHSLVSCWSDNNNTRSEVKKYCSVQEGGSLWDTGPLSAVMQCLSPAVLEYCWISQCRERARCPPDVQVWVGKRETDSQKGWLKVINALEMISPHRSGRGKVHLSYLQRGKVRSRALPRPVCHWRDSWTALCGGADSRLRWKCAIRGSRVQVVVQSAQRGGLELASVVNGEAL